MKKSDKYTRFSNRLIIAVLLLTIFSISVFAGEEQYNYYFAEGKVSTQAFTFINILNPNTETANITATIYYNNGSVSQFQYNCLAKRKTKIDLGKFALNNTDFGIKLESSLPLVVQGTHYSALFSAGHGAMAKDKLSTVFYFGEGYKSGGVHTYLHVLNPELKNAELIITIFYTDGTSKVIKSNMKYQTKKKIDLNDFTLPSKQYGVMVTSTQPVIIQQSHYEKLFSGGSGDFGSNTLSKEWYFSEGYTSGSATDFIFILNPENIASQVKFNIFYDDGSSDTFEQSIPPNSKKTILMNNHVKEYKWYGLKIESNKNILAHQVHYDNTYSAGHGSIGTQIPSDNWYFAEGYNSINNKEYITILNPNQKPVETNFSILYSDGSNKKFSINTKPNSRETVRLDQYVISRADYGIIMKSNLPIITHQVHYDKKYSAGHGSPGVTNIPIIIAKNINENLSKQENKSKTIINKTYFINTTKDRNYTKTTPARNTENSQLSFLVSIIVGLVFIVLAWKRIKGLNCKNKENPKNKKLNKDIAKAVDEKRKKKEEKKKKLAEEERKKKEEEKKQKEAKRKEEEKKQKEAKRKEEEKAEKEKKKESNETKPTKNSEEKKEQPKELEKEEQHKENKEETKKHKKDKEN